MSTQPLSGLRVIEIGDLPAAAYCARFFADFGADVLKIEPPAGDPARAAPPILTDSDPGLESGWFAYLNFGKRSAVADADAAGRAELARLLARADVVVDSLSPSERTAWGIDHAALRRARPGVVIADLSWFGQGGPYSDYRGTDAVVRALGGQVQLIGPAEGPPLALPDFQSAIVGGLSAFIPLLASLPGRDRAGGGQWEISVLESVAALAEYQACEAQPSGRGQPRLGINRFTPTYPMGVYRCREGWLGVTVVTPLQWASFCELLGLGDLAHHPDYHMGPERLRFADTLEPRITAGLATQTADHWFERGLEMKLPFTVVPDMARVLATATFRDRGAIATIRAGRREFEAPRSPLHLSRTLPAATGEVPSLGSTAIASAWADPAAPVRFDGPARRPVTSTTGPLAGLRIIDLSMGWAGPLCTRQMGDLGADIIKVEACGYPDWWRGTSQSQSDFEQKLFEKYPRFLAMNRNKRGITLDLTSPDGAALLKALVRDADAVVENYSSQVLPKMGLAYADLCKVNPSLVMVSMAAYGATGPWSDCRGYGSTLEQGSGLPSVSGREGDPPVMNHIAHGDAVGGLNAACALLVALHHRERTGIGQHVDLAQVECMLPFVAPWVIEQSANGSTGPRTGNRHPSYAPHGVYRCQGSDAWLLVAVTDDAAWQALCSVIGDPGLAADPALAQAAGRRAQAERIDAALSAWCAGHDPDAAMRALQQAGVAAGTVRAPVDLYKDPHLVARGAFPEVERPHVGRHPLFAAPYRSGPQPIPVRWPAPTMGQFNREVLGGVLGLSEAEMATLTDLGVIGESALPPAQRKRSAPVR
ncbi:MAG TPA: CoA transferase [Burkholderiaceae bacterium]|nr:CoA transferase [Burkholderiaceae bacterium]